jgi:hypothetical protein
MYSIIRATATSAPGGRAQKNRSGMRPLALTAAGLAAAATLAACGNSTPSTLPTTSPTASSTPTVTAPAWQAAYSKAQIGAYDAALARWKAFETAYNQIVATGQDTPGAEATIKQYTAISGLLIFQLKQEQANGLQVAGSKVLWVKATSIAKTADSLTLEECADYTGIKVTKFGKPVAPANKAPRVLTTISMSKPKGYDWLVYSMNTDMSGKSCAPTL